MCGPFLPGTAPGYTASSTGAGTTGYSQLAVATRSCCPSPWSCRPDPSPSPGRPGLRQAAGRPQDTDLDRLHVRPLLMRGPFLTTEPALRLELVALLKLAKDAQDKDVDGKDA